MFRHKITFDSKPIDPCEGCTESSCCACSGAETQSPCGSDNDIDCDN
jgi:hypothetical protein